MWKWMRYTKKKALSFKVESLSSRDYLKKENAKRKKGKCARQQKQSVDRDTANYDRFSSSLWAPPENGIPLFFIYVCSMISIQTQPDTILISRVKLHWGPSIAIWINVGERAYRINGRNIFFFGFCCLWRRWNRKLFMRKIRCEMNEKARRPMEQCFFFQKGCRPMLYVADVADVFVWKEYKNDKHWPKHCWKCGEGNLWKEKANKWD